MSTPATLRNCFPADRGGITSLVSMQFAATEIRFGAQWGSACESGYWRLTQYKLPNLIDKTGQS